MRTAGLLSHLTRQVHCVQLSADTDWGEIIMETLSLMCLSLLVLRHSALSLPAITGNKLSLEVLSGGNIELPCDNLHGGVRIWSKDDRVLFAGPLRVRVNRKFDLKDENLLITDMTSSDGGKYVCSMELETGVVMNINFQVTVLEAPTATIEEGPNLAVKSGTSLALRCIGSGVPVPEVVWRRGGEVMSRGEGEAGILLEYITREDAGDIVCEASNGVGHSTARDVLTLDVLYAPEVEMMEPHISFQPKCGLELQCQVHSSSEPSVSWYHNDLLLQPTDGVTIWSLDNLHVLQVSSCDQSIIGHFSCKATNNMGEGEAGADISYQRLQQELDLFKQGEEEQEEQENINNVRRNVILRQEHSLPLTSSSSSVSVISFSMFTLFSMFLI